MARVRLVAALVLSWASPVAAQTIVNPDFENGLTGWTATGTAFQGQPVAAAAVSIEVVRPIPIGGNYWSGLPYPIGQSGAHLIRAARGTGRLMSSPFTIGATGAF